MGLKVCKFGGTSLATREQIEKALDIVLSDRARRIMVVSAPGARYKGDTKMTDLLIELAEKSKQARAVSLSHLDAIIDRFKDIIPDNPRLLLDLSDNLKARLLDSSADNYKEAVMAFGEYASAVVVNDILRNKGIRAEFLDPLELGFRVLTKGGLVIPDPTSYDRIKKAVFHFRFDRAVVPGFYAYNAEGELRTLPRGGSDVSGAVIARGVNADTYENWTDENGLKRADPRIVSDAETIATMTYLEARELAYMGFKLQDRCFEPLRGTEIALDVRNTNNPKHLGTRITESRVVDPEERIVGVACENDGVLMGFRKMYSDQEVGLGRKMFTVLERFGIPYEHSPTGVDTFSLVVRARYLNSKPDANTLAKKIARACKSEIVGVKNIAILGIAGLGIQNHFDVHGRVHSTLERCRVKPQMCDEGACDLSYFFGVEREKSADVVRAIYDEFFSRK
jgi:aspartate kinase